VDVVENRDAHGRILARGADAPQRPPPRSCAEARPWNSARDFRRRSARRPLK
jgi:hypothetical protein